MPIRVFDIRLREGNYDKHDSRDRMVSTGLKVGVEGPISKKLKASYMASYRILFWVVLALPCI
jgi:hypothetical protein